MFRFLIRSMLVVVFLLAVLLLGVLVLFTENTPRLAAKEPPSAEDIMAARTFVQDVRAASGAVSAQGGTVQTTRDQLNSFARIGARFVPDFRGEFDVQDGQVQAVFALPLPWPSGQKWLNISGRLPAFDDGIVIDKLVVGTRSVPPALALWLVRVGGDLAIGNSFGSRVLDAPQSMQIVADTLIFQVRLDEMGKNNVMRGLFGSLRGESLPALERVIHFETLLRDAMTDGTLNLTGSYLPYIRFTLNRVAAESDNQSLIDNYTAAILALAKVCGARDFATIIGGIAFDDVAPNATDVSCEGVTLNGRDDSRRHFTTAAALQAASNRGFSVSVGEFKELYDAARQWGTGFDFTDIAANNSGIRMSDFLMQQPPAAWPAIIASLTTESDIIIAYDGLPDVLDQADFLARFGDIDSRDYKAVLAEIEARIDRIAIYQTP